VRLGGRTVRWGLDTLEGRLPYLQPAYPRFEQQPPPQQPMMGTAASHCPWMAELGARTRAGTPRRRTTSIPSRVLPDPGGATRCVLRLPARRSASKASSARAW
jgi:hypothetical protein